jgi:hypothetical protein
MWIHLTARTRFEFAPFDDPEIARWFWRRLRSAFPRALAATLMPNHFHLVTDDDLETARIRTSKILGSMAREHGLAGRAWEPVPQPSMIPNREKLLRDLRYLALNPCRAKLCRDPLEWPWSTYRGVVGALADPWVSSERLSEALGDRSREFARGYHRYITSDPSVSVSGSPFPRAAPPTAVTWVPLESIALAAAAATESPLASVRTRGAARSAFIWLALHQGWNDFALLGERANVGYEAARVSARTPDPRVVAAAALCLGDTRLTRALEPARRAAHPAAPALSR